MLKVTFSANVPHYYSAALALQEAEYLQKCICAVGMHQGSRWLHEIPLEYWEKKLRGWDASGIEPERVKSLWLPEILQKGLPVLACEEGLIGHLTREHELGLLVTVRDPHAVARAVGKLAKNPALSKELGEIGRKVARNYSPERFVRIILEGIFG